jgi:hypothetical protein
MKNQEEEKYSENNLKRGKANWIRHMLCRSFILKQIIYGKRREGQSDGKT